MIKIVLPISFLLLLFSYSCTSLKYSKVDESYGKKISYVERGAGSPTVVFESGFDSGMETWDVLLDSMANITRVYAYDRPGYGRSNLKDAPHSFEEVADQLHANLIARNIPAPFVLVGYSEGALIVNMFARKYPEKTHGVLMIDPTHPDLFDYLKEHERILYDIQVDHVGDGQRMYELDLIRNSSEEFLNANTFPDIPLTILMASRHTSLENEALKQKVLDFHEELKNMSAEGQRFMVEDSGHQIHRKSPERIIEEIMRLIGSP